MKEHIDKKAAAASAQAAAASRKKRPSLVPVEVRGTGHTVTLPACAQVCGMWTSTCTTCVSCCLGAAAGNLALLCVAPTGPQPRRVGANTVQVCLRPTNSNLEVHYFKYFTTPEIREVLTSAQP